MLMNTEIDDSPLIYTRYHRRDSNQFIGWQFFDLFIYIFLSQTNHTPELTYVLNLLEYEEESIHV